MQAAIETESTLTDRYQTTVPETVRRALHLGKRDKLRYSIRTTGEVVLTRAQDEDDKDPVMEQFLSFLSKDMANSPERLQAIDTHLAQQLRALTAGVEIDLDAPLSQEDE